MKRILIRKSFLVAGLAGGIAVSANGATIIEPFGPLAANFEGTPSGPSAVGAAPGLSGAGSAYGSTTADPDYVISFTPGTDGDNYTPLSGFDFGNGTELASGMTQADLDGGTGQYRVFVTWPATDNVSGGVTTYTVTSDGTDLVYVINQNDSAFGDGSFGSNPGGNSWLLLGTVGLTAGNTYTLTASPTEDTFTSMRMAGVMFEPIPEPSTYAAIFGGLALVGAAFYRRRLNAKK